jgi:ABC-type multidrug transport system fused ATPase/permease subunit
MSDDWLESDRPEGGADGALLAWVLAYARPQAPALAGCVVLVLALAGLQLAQPWVISRAIDSVLDPAAGALPPEAATRALLGLVAAYLALLIAAVVLNYSLLYWILVI